MSRKQSHNSQTEENQEESIKAPAESEQKAEQPTAQEAEKQSDKDPVYVIADGVSRTSKIGILNAGDTVKPEYFKGGQEIFDRLFESKVIVRKP